MSDRLYPLSLEQLTAWIADELAAKDSIFGIPRELFFRPGGRERFRTTIFGHALETPMGVAAGPHSQMAGNIVAAWLCGARFIELKTVQTLDGIEIPKPCIDMQDEGYNVEWSQELSIGQSFAEYLHAWVLIHALHCHLGFPGRAPGVVFNLSVGYDLAGIRSANMQWYLDRVEDAGARIEQCVAVVARRFPALADIEVPRRLSDSVTLSTMHGCPPEEIGAIGAYLLAERGLHTFVKLNPTLLGAETVREILNRRLGYRNLEVGDASFDGDLAYPDALTLVEELRARAGGCGRDFGVKLTNTLAVANHRPVFDDSETTMYLSGRPLHALAVTLAHRLSEDVSGRLPMSFSGGADATRIASLLRCGLRPVTVCSDLLKPGGYLRLGQYLESLETAMLADGAADLGALVHAGAPEAHNLAEAARSNLRRYAAAVLEDPALHKEAFDRDHTKTSRVLGLFDCIRAPCTDACDVDQKVPEYMRRVRLGDLAGAAAITREDNPLASILGRTCHHPCEPVCLRTHMDRPLAIREIKRLITDHERPPCATARPGSVGEPIAVIGGGPCGLAAASFLARARRPVTIFEARTASGGMVSDTIPGYRAAREAIERDLQRVAALGVEVRCGQEVGREMTLETLRAEGFGPVVIAVGARRGRRLGIDGEDSEGVLDGLDFLRAVRRGVAPATGSRVGVIGGGDVAMDCARTALRLGSPEVTVFYRRTRAEMPAQQEEVRDLLVEGGRLEELAAPIRIRATRGRIEGLVMARMRLGAADESGRRRPEAVPGEELEVELDTLIVAVGQSPDLGVLGGVRAELTPAGYLVADPVTGQTSIPGVYAGGDIAGAGPASIVAAAGDGRRIAEAVLARSRTRPEPLRRPEPWPSLDRVDLLRRRARIEPRVDIPQRPPSTRNDFSEVILTMTPEVGAAEAWRCLDCDVLCSTCEGVCPNRAIVTYTARPELLQLPRLTRDGDAVRVAGSASLRIEQGPQVAVLADLCNECGNCVTFCPTAGRPWRDKPRLYLDRAELEAEPDNAFMLLRRGDARGLDARFAGETHRLWAGRVLHYSSPTLRLVLDAETLEVESAVAAGPAPGGELLDPVQLGAMLVLLSALTESMPELPAVDVDPD